jgi:hypothetical protein
LVEAMAWISSMMMLSTLRSVSRACEVNIRYKDSGVVIRMSEGRRKKRARSSLGVSPVRTATCSSWYATSRRSALRMMPDSGARRFFSMSKASALSGETYTRRQRSCFSGAGENSSRSMAQRKAESVLPEPVGASSSVFCCAMIAGQAFNCASVGAAKVSANQRRVGS